ncbi:MAG: ABC transporter ATP-binding protein, partial [Candidatus Krumholzibacteriota bacterium]|nr:ABC transporter ATP-binding protein [Candidatus Krumholzibacteriota bacterium]
MLDGPRGASLPRLMLRIYLRLLRYLLPYWRRVVLALGAIVIYALLSGISVTLVVPFLDNLFQQGPAAPTAVERVGGEVERSLNDASPHVARAKAWKDARLAAVRAWLDRGGHGERLQRVLVIIFLAFLLKNLFGYLETYLVNWLEQRVLLDMRQHLYGHLQGLPLAFLGRQKTGVLMSRLVNDVNTLRGAIIGATATLLRNGLMIAVFLAIIFEINWRLALATILIVPPNAWLMRRLGRLLRRDSTLIQERMGEMAGLIQETMTGARVVKAFGREADETRRFGRFNRQYFLSAIRLRALGALNAPMSEMLGTLSVVVIVGWGGHQVLQGRWPASHLVLFVTAVLSIAGPLRKISELNQMLQEGTAAGTRVFAILDEPGEHADLAAGDAPGPLRDAIRYERVGFAYNAGEPVLCGIDLAIPRGAVVALVGPSGGGKSTLADLLARFYEPTDGRIAMDGRDVRDFNLAKWRAKMGIVTQDVVLFNDTIYANIAYGRPGASREEVEAAAGAALAADFIARAPAGYDTVIGERGLQLSGGERQRLAIARAILRDPEILIFDEATSALDTESERLVQAAIERLMEGRTTLVIAHRLS